jgi:Phosphotransferase enzyme family
VSEFLAKRIEPDAPIERSIFGTRDAEAIWSQVLAICPDAVDCFAFEVSVGALFGLRRADGERIALKVHVNRAFGSYLEQMQTVQEHLWRTGFPAPRPLGVRGLATLEEWRDEGTFLDAHHPDVRRVLAELLARLIQAARELEPSHELAPFFPMRAAPLWPTPHNVLFDFDATAAEAGWIDEIARAARKRRDAGPGDFVIGHHDWTVKHVRFDGLRPTVVYDWDSTSADLEPVFVGGAAATFTYTEHLPVALWPTVGEAQAFLDDYEQARGRPFTAGERGTARAAAVYSRAYSTRCVHALGGDPSELELDAYAHQLLK